MARELVPDSKKSPGNLRSADNQGLNTEKFSFSQEVKMSAFPSGYIQRK